MRFYNFISLIPILIIIYTILKKKYELLIYLILITITQLFIKYLTRNNKKLLRPKGACDCGIINKGGDASSEPGFPSGHVALTSFFVNYMYFKSFNNYGTDIDLFFINLIPIFVGLSRYKKKCHNSFQIFSGYLLSILPMIEGFSGHLLRRGQMPYRGTTATINIAA